MMQIWWFFRQKTVFGNQNRWGNETVWVTQDQIAMIFNKSVSTVSEHINNIFKEEEADQSECMRKFGNPENSFTKPKNYYNLDIILAVGYRTYSTQAINF